MQTTTKLLSKKYVAFGVPSCRSTAFPDLFAAFPPFFSLIEDVVHGLHLCLITGTDGSVTGTSFPSPLCSHSFSPLSYCQHTFTSNSMPTLICNPCSSHRMNSQDLCSPFSPVASAIPQSAQTEFVN